ncbi:MAG: hypothetical protein ING37_06210 [Rhodocyclaceae bacterium]|nr:hypothetical protein [Rhodocyclaceae bacterium]MCA3086962.1 hypothetical protein [Rhodocyclaceae bacterium]
MLRPQVRSTATVDISPTKSSLLLADIGLVAAWRVQPRQMGGHTALGRSMPRDGGCIPALSAPSSSRT